MQRQSYDLSTNNALAAGAAAGSFPAAIGKQPAVAVAKAVASAVFSATPMLPPPGAKAPPAFTADREPVSTIVEEVMNP